MQDFFHGRGLRFFAYRGQKDRLPEDSRSRFAACHGTVLYDIPQFYLWTLAPAPPMMASTSFLLAIVVSPGVVIASAPCAAP